MDGIFYDKTTGLWYVIARGIRFDGFLTHEEAYRWENDEPSPQDAGSAEAA